MNQIYILDRVAIDEARTLLTRFGDGAGLEAAMQAGASRERGNLVHYCRWREVERIVDLLALEEPTGTVH